MGRVPTSSRGRCGRRRWPEGDTACRRATLACGEWLAARLSGGSVTRRRRARLRFISPAARCRPPAVPSASPAALEGQCRLRPSVPTAALPFRLYIPEAQAYVGTDHGAETSEEGEEDRAGLGAREGREEEAGRRR